MKKPSASGNVINTIINGQNVDALKICSTCKSTLDKNNIPHLSVYNGFHYPKTPQRLRKIDFIAERLISPRIPFMQIRIIRHIRTNYQCSCCCLHHFSHLSCVRDGSFLVFALYKRNILMSEFLFRGELIQNSYSSIIIHRVNWPATFTNVKPKAYIWDALGMQVAASSSLLKTIPNFDFEYSVFSTDKTSHFLLSR